VWCVKYTRWSVNIAVSKAVKESEQWRKNGGKWRNFEAQFWAPSMEYGVWSVAYKVWNIMQSRIILYITIEFEILRKPAGKLASCYLRTK